MPIQYIRFALFVANNVKHISLRKLFDLFSSVSKEIIPGATTPTFQEVGSQSNFSSLFQQKHTIWVFKRTVSMRGSKPRFWLFSLNRRIVFRHSKEVF